MSLAVKVRIGGESGSTVWDATDQVPIFDASSQPLLDAGHMYGGDGNASQFQFEVDDPVGEIPRADRTKNLASHNVVTVIEDAPGFDCWIGRGRIADKGVSRGGDYRDDHRYFVATVDDGNTDFRGLALLAEWVRPAESGRARVLAALTAFCDGDPRLTTVIASHLVAAGDEVTMPAHTYPANTDLPEIFRDCATTEGKLWGAVIHHLADVSHLCMLYILESDHTTFASGLSITDDDPDLATEFPPIWDQGDATIESGGDNPVSHLVSRWGADDQVVVAEQLEIIESYDYWAVPFYDSAAETQVQAQIRADAMAASRSTEHVTHQVSIQITAEQVDLVGAGMSIDIKSAASMGGEHLGTNQTRRIGQCKFEKISPTVAGVEGYYLAHLQLNRPQKRMPERVGDKALTTMPKVGTFDPTCDTGDCTEAFMRTDDSGWGTSEILGLAWTPDGSGSTIPSQGRAYLPPLNGSSASNRQILDFTTLTLPVEILMAVELQAPVAGMVGGSGTNRLDIEVDVRASLGVTGTGLWRWNITGIDNDDHGLPIGMTIYTLNGGGGGSDSFVIPGVFSNPGRLWVVMRCEADAVRVKTWYAGTSEPLEWTKEFTVGGTGSAPRYLVITNRTTDDDLGGDVWVNSICFRAGASCSDGFCGCGPESGQFVSHILVGNGDGAVTAFTIPYASGYFPGSLTAVVDGIEQNVIEDNAASGQFSFEFAPEADEIVHASWRVP